MCLLFETIQIRHRKAERIKLHNMRMNYSRQKLFGCSDFIDLQNHIPAIDNFPDEIYKCKVVYSKTIENIIITPYSPRKIESLELVECNDIDYTHKFENRVRLDDLKAKSMADEIIIVKNGLVTDTSFSNLIFYDGRRWLTPQTPLLEGTMRRYLLDKQMIVVKKITPNDLHSFISVKLINAMLDFSNTTEIMIDKVLC